MTAFNRFASSGGSCAVEPILLRLSAYYDKLPLYHNSNSRQVEQKMGNQRKFGTSVKIPLAATLLAMLPTIMAPQQAMAYDVVTVAGGTISAPDVDAAVAAASTAIVAAIAAHGSDRAANAKQLLAALEQLSANQNQVLRDTSVMSGNAAGQVEAIRIFGSQGTDRNCIDTAGKPVAAGKAAVRADAASSGTAMETRARKFGKTEDVVVDINQRKPEDIAAAKLYPPSGVRDSAAQTDKAALTALATDPSPPLKLADKSKTTPEGKRYEAARTLYEASKTPARAAAAEADAYNAPDFKAGVGKWAADAIAEAGLDKTAYTDSAGNFSFESFMRLQVDYRTANDEWYLDAKERQDDVWQLRHINLSMAVLMEIQKKQLDLLNKLVELEAKHYALEVDKTLNPELAAARAAAVSRN
jgi:hypothetical protein